jgi:HEAT repeat protein
MGPFSEGWTEADVEAVLNRGNPEELLYVPIVIGMSAQDCERSWVERICFRLAEHPHFNVRGNAVLGLGHIARTCRALDLAKAVPLIEKALNDQNEFVQGQADSAADDVETYLGFAIHRVSRST